MQCVRMPRTINVIMSILNNVKNHVVSSATRLNQGRNEKPFLLEDARFGLIIPGDEEPFSVISHQIMPGRNEKPFQLEDARFRLIFHHLPPSPIIQTQMRFIIG